MPQTKSANPPAALTAPPRLRWSRWVLAGYALALATATHWPHLSLAVPDVGNVGFDKILHFAAFGLFMALLIAARPAGRGRSFRLNLLVSLVVAVAFAGVDEYTQQFVNRTTSWLDFSADLMAMLCVNLSIAAGHSGLVHLRHGSVALRAIASRAFLAFLAPLAALFLLMPDYRSPSFSPLVRLAQKLHQNPDKLGYFLGAMALVWVLSATRLAGPRRAWLSRALAVVIVAALGPAIELGQYFTNRGYELPDVLAHERGLAAGIGLWLAAYAIWRILPSPIPGAPVPGAGKEGRKATSEDRPADVGAKGHSSFVGHAKVVSVLTFLSRITGLFRDSYLAAVFGVGAISDAFWLGFLVPNLFRRLFGEGALTAAFIPVYADLLAKDRLLARRLASLCLGLAMVVLGALTILGELALAGMLQAGNWTQDSSLAIRLTMVMLPYMPLVCLVALIGSVLQVHGRFAPAAGMPIFLNVVMVAGTCLAAWGVRDDASLRRAMYLVGISVVAAGLVQVVAQWSLLKRYESFTLVFGGVGPAFKSVMTSFLPMLITLSIFQINTAADSLLASVLSPKDGSDGLLHILGWSVPYPIDQGGLTAMNNANRLYQFPLGVFGLAIASAIFPALAHAAAQTGPEGRKDFRHILQQGLRLTLFIGLPASVGLILVRVPAARVIYQHGKVTLQDACLIANVLAAFAPAIWAYSMTHVITRAFYALKDPKTPLRISLAMVGLNLALNLTLVWKLGVAGLALSTAICAVLQNVLLLRALRRRVDQPVSREVWAGWWRSGLLTLGMALVLAPIPWMYNPTRLSRSESALELLVMVCLGMIVYVAGAWLTHTPELAWLWRRRVE